MWVSEGEVCLSAPELQLSHRTSQYKIPNVPKHCSDVTEPPVSVSLTCVSPGGRGMNGSPIIVFPEFPDFSELEEEEIQNVLGYLSSIPRLAHTQTHKGTHSRQLHLV